MPALLLVLCLPLGAQAGIDATVQRVIHMLDYIGVDYPGAVRDRKVTSLEEYREQQEFAAEVRRQLGQLPENGRRPALLEKAAALEQAINTLAAPDEVARLTRELQRDLLQGYPVTLAPRSAPDPAAGARLYAERCSGCHGATGRGDGPLAAGLPIRPSDFHDLQRQRQRSLLGYFNTITLGVEGTPMQGFPDLTQAQRWALAFHVGRWTAQPELVEEGGRLWREERWRARFPDLAALVQARPAEVEREYGREGLAVLAWLRSHPQALAGESPMAVTRQRLAESLRLARAGDSEGAYRAALSAYLDGFELMETGLRSRTPDLVARIEAAMLGYREGLRRQLPLPEVEGRYGSVLALLDEVEALTEQARAGSMLTFTGALVILLREGMEALLLIVLIAVTVLRAGRPEALRYIHFGWIGALLAGILTWGVSNYFLQISGAGRELTEGLTALLATAVLLYVGLWLHDKAHASRWQHFMREQIDGSLDGGRLWLLAGVVFLAAYREVFETILFYQVLWLQSAGQERDAMLLGIATAVAALLVLGWLIWQFSARLPLRLFFNINALLLFVLAVVFAGKGIAALQEAGLLPVTLLGLPRIDWLGIYPTLQGLVLQFLILLFGAWWFLLRKGKTPQTAG
ncbi:MAG: hypothetical protein D6786_10285 [Gammaproteobacteria bacterium]|nr:MAG: hypothetical protein D6786_10285 [Gammaproteobacteria bacterium]